MPELVLDRVKDDLGNPVLVLHGAGADASPSRGSSPNLRPGEGVEIARFYRPSGVPHTRPTPVHVQATEKALAPEQPQMAATLRFQRWLSQGAAGDQGFWGFSPPSPSTPRMPSCRRLRTLECFVGSGGLNSSRGIDTRTPPKHTASDLNRNFEMAAHCGFALEEHFDALSGWQRRCSRESTTHSFEV